ncbi:MAG TPA: ABC transporter permease [Gaiellales bacterium]
MSATTNDPVEVARRIRGEGKHARGGWRDVVRALARSRRGQVGVVLLLLFLFIAVFGHLLAKQDPNAASSFSTNGAENLQSPSSAHWLGTDESGRDVLSELLYAAPITLTVGLAAALISTLLGTLVGVIAGYYGGWTDRLLMALDDWVLVLPFIPTAIVIASLLGKRASGWPLGRESVLILVIGGLGWAGTSRIVRSQVLTLRERDYVARARVLGSPDRTIMLRHILPGVIPLVLANAVLYVSVSVLAETTLSFLGLGDTSNFSWGQMLNDAYTAGAMTEGKWAYFLPPGICVTLLAMAFSLSGNALEEIVNPSSRRERG